MQYLLLMCSDETADQRPEDDCRVPGQVPTHSRAG